jgi:DnaK suppressor protein
MKKLNVTYFKGLFENMKQSGNFQEFQDNISTRMEGDDVDKAQLEREQSLLLKLKQREKFYHKKIDAALAKIEDGTFGHCEDCDCAIGERRLMARPMATMCISCKEENEREESGVLYERRSHTIGKKLVVVDDSRGVKNFDRDEVKVNTRQSLAM